MYNILIRLKMIEDDSILVRAGWQNKFHKYYIERRHLLHIN